MGRANNAEMIDEEDDDSVLTITNAVGNMQMANNAQSQAVREDVTELRREIGFLRAEISAHNQGAAIAARRHRCHNGHPRHHTSQRRHRHSHHRSHHRPRTTRSPSPSHRQHLMQPPRPTTHASPPSISDSRDEEGEEGEQGGGEHKGAAGAALE